MSYRKQNAISRQLLYLARFKSAGYIDAIPCARDMGLTVAWCKQAAAGSLLFHEYDDVECGCIRTYSFDYVKSKFRRRSLFFDFKSFFYYYGAKPYEEIDVVKYEIITRGKDPNDICKLSKDTKERTTLLQHSSNIEKDVEDYCSLFNTSIVEMEFSRRSRYHLHKTMLCYYLQQRGYSSGAISSYLDICENTVVCLHSKAVWSLNHGQASGKAKETMHLIENELLSR